MNKKQKSSKKKQIAKSKSRVQVQGKQHAHDCFKQGVALMEMVQSDPYADDATQNIKQARMLLQESVTIAQKKGMSERISFMISLGNTWKTSPNENIEKSIQIYEKVTEQLQRYSKDRSIIIPPELKAMLWKVHADALCLRGHDDDLRRADRLLERSCRIRTGRFLAETLISRANVARRHPDRDETTRQREAIRFMRDALQASPELGEQPMAGTGMLLIEHLLRMLSHLEQNSPEEPLLTLVRRELKTLYPHRSVQIDMPLPHFSPVQIEQMVAILSHPAGIALNYIRIRLSTPHEWAHDPAGLLNQISPSMKAKVIENQAENSLIDRPEQIEALLGSLESAPHDEAYPGVLTAKVTLLAYLTRKGLRSVDEVRAATSEARKMVQQMSAPPVQSFLFQELARNWSPNEHRDDPVCDFSLAADILRESLKIEGGEDQASNDTLAFLARALRYSPDGDHLSNLRESYHLYTIALHNVERTGQLDMVALYQQHLADLESHLGIGRSIDRVQAAIQRLEKVLGAAQSPRQSALFTASLAWELTQLGGCLSGLEAQRALERASSMFDEVDLTVLDEALRLSVEHNHFVCQTMLIKHTRGPHAVIPFLRERLAQMDAHARPHLAATVKHNLAYALALREDSTWDELMEGVQLFREVTQLRTAESDPRHRWETTLSLGRALYQMLAPEYAGQCLSREAIADEAHQWLQQAAVAAQALGAGEELFHTARALWRLAWSTATTTRLIQIAEEAWDYIRQASAYLLLDDQSRLFESWAAGSTALGLADRFASKALELPIPELLFVLHGEHAQCIERWILRAQLPIQRPLHAQLAYAQGLSAQDWQQWCQTIRTRDQRKIAEELHRIQENHPKFLAEEQANEALWDWLAARPGSVAITLLLDEDRSLAFLLHVDPEGARKRWVLGLALPPPPLHLNLLMEQLYGTPSEEHALAHLQEFSQWIQKGAFQPILRFLKEPPSAILWCPDPRLRRLPPSMIWGPIPVATVTSLHLTDRATLPMRHKSTLLMLADPGPSSGPSLDLRGYGVPALMKLAAQAKKQGPVHLLGSVGPEFGHTLLKEQPSVHDAPASADALLSKAKEHEVIVLIAHGEVKILEDAALLCLDAHGQIDRLDIEKLQGAPDAFLGATVILLVCDSGQMSGSPVEAGGIVGTLLAAGAACVVAPITPVRVDVAEQVGSELLQGLAAGEAPWERCAQFAKEARVTTQGTPDKLPDLGRPPTSRSPKRAGQLLQRLSFVTWIS